MPHAALPYSPDVEQVAADEAETTNELIRTMRSIAETTLTHGGHVLRSVHAKSHAIIQAEVEILQGLPPALAQGLFATAGRHPAILRFSTNPGDILDDSVSVPRGLAIKILDVAGERLPGAEEATTQDIVMANAPAFAAATSKDFLQTLKLLAATTDKGEGLKKVLSGAMRGVQTVVTAVTGSPSPTIGSLGGQPATHILGETFYTQTPYRYGAHIAKLRVQPSSEDLKALVGQTITLSGHPNALRDAAFEFFRGSDAAWELQVQLWTDAETMPIEDASVVWPEEKSAWQTVARITAPAQTSWSEARAVAVDDGLSFSPWHGLAAHRPLGGINRSRKPAYEAGRQFRSEHGRPITEPQSVALPA